MEKESLAVKSISSKPLIKLYNLSLIERSIKKLSDKLNVNKIYIITGFKHDKLKIHLDKLKKKLTVDLEIIFAKEWEKGNGASFLSVLNSIKEKTILFVNGRPYFQR